MASGIYYPLVQADDGSRYSTSSFSIYNYLTIGNYNAILYHIFVRFPNVTIPAGATITSAFIRFTAQAAGSATVCNEELSFNDVDNAVAPGNYTEYDALVKTTAKVDWTGIGAWSTDVQYDSVDITTVLQEVIDRAGWSSGNAVMLLGDGTGSDNSAHRLADVYSGTGKAELHVTWASDTEITLPTPFSSETSLQSNFQVELVPGALSAESSLSISEPFWGSYVELPSPFSSEGSLQAKTGLDIALAPLVAQANLQSNIQVEIVPPAFASQSELSISEIWYGILITLPNPFSANASLQANTQIELVPSPLIATGALFSNLGIEVSAGILNATGAILATPVYPIILTGAKRIYLFTLTGTADGVEDITIPISSFQSRAKTVEWGTLKLYSLGTSYVVVNWVSNITYLSVVIPGFEYATDINDRLNGNLVVRMGYKKDDEILLSEIAINVTFENIRIDEGATNKSITLDGHGYDIIHELQELNLAGASYKSLDGGNLRYRCAPNLYLRPGDTATINGDSFTVKNIVRSVSPELETYEISE